MYVCLLSLDEWVVGSVGEAHTYTLGALIWAYLVDLMGKPMSRNADIYFNSAAGSSQPAGRTRSVGLIWFAPTAPHPGPCTPQASIRDKPPNECPSPIHSLDWIPSPLLIILSVPVARGIEMQASQPAAITTGCASSFRLIVIHSVVPTLSNTVDTMVWRHQHAHCPVSPNSTVP